MPRSYTLELTPDAKADLQRIDKPNASRIIKKLRWVAANVDDVNHTALTGQWAGYFRYRIGDYRAIYILDDEGHVLLVAVIGHRREVYDEYQFEIEAYKYDERSKTHTHLLAR